MEESYREPQTVEQALLRLAGGLLSEEAARSAGAPVAPEALPDPFRSLLVHREHMTSQLEAFYARPVTLHVLVTTVEGAVYRRRIALTAGDANLIELGIARIHLDRMPDDVRLEIQQQRMPLGDILIRHEVMRVIEPRWYLRVPAGGALAQSFDLRATGLKPPPGVESYYGRIGAIRCNQEPAIELLEIVTGAPRAGKL